MHDGRVLTISPDGHELRALLEPLAGSGRFLLGLAGAPREAREHRADELLERVGLGDRRNAHPRELSGGEQQRIAVCAALATRPALLIADEPTGELDAASARELLGLIGELVRESGSTALVVSHGAALRTWVSTRMAPHSDAPPATQPLHNTALIVLEGDHESGWEMVSWQGHPVGGDFLEDPTAEDPTGDLDPDGDGEIG